MKKFISLLMSILLVCACLPMAISADTGFTDVPPTAYFAEAVEWAVENNITAGISATKFGPNNPCTRGQIVSFLWRAAGSPDPVSSDNPFADVKADAYYYKAVLWAVENNITAGMSANKFGPNNPCTRGQIVSFLWRYAGTPDPVSTNNPFADVKADAYYYKAVLWAVENNITAGMSADKFAPNSPCTRGQIVCFLQRYMATAADELRIVTQPADFYMEYSEADATFTVEIEGGEPNYYYDWYVEGEKKATHGATSATSDSFTYHVTDYDFDYVQGSYLDVICVVTDIKGTEVTSITAKLYKKEATKPLEITKQPKDYQMTSSMEEATFTVEISGGKANYYYDWYILKDNNETKVAHGATSAMTDTLSYTFSDYDFEDYRDISVYCVVTDVEGTEVTSSSAEVLPKKVVAPLKIVTQPADYQMQSSMEDATFTVEISGGKANYYYDWSIWYDNKEVKISHGPTSAVSDTLTYEFSDYDFDDYREIAVCCVITDIEGTEVTSSWAEVLQS